MTESPKNPGRFNLVPHIPFPRTPKKLPTVLSTEEVARLLRAVPNLKHRALLITIYATGLRISEALALKVTDIDSERMVITVRQGKGLKDRTVMLSPQLLEVLRRYARQFPPRDWLFPGSRPEQPIHATVVQRACAQARLVAGLSKPATVHTLRHSFATHLLEAAAGSGHGPAVDSNAARTSEPQDDGDLHARVGAAAARYAQSP